MALRSAVELFISLKGVKYMRQIQRALVAAAILLAWGGLEAQAQQFDSMWVECAPQYPESTTVYVPVMIQLGPNPPTPPGGMTACQLMFGNDSGITIDAIHWDGTAIGQPPTAIETYIGAPPVWSMNNAGPTYRGGAGTFTFANDPNIPAPGTYLFVYLEVSVGVADTYCVGPAMGDGMGIPPIVNSFAYKLTPSDHLWLNDCCMVVTGRFLTLTNCAEHHAEEGEVCSFNVTASIIGGGHKTNSRVCVFMIEGPAGATFANDCGEYQITSRFEWMPDFCQAGTTDVLFEGTYSYPVGDEYVEVCAKTGVTPIVVWGINHPCFVDAGPDINRPPPEGVVVTATVSDLDMTLCHDDTVIFTDITIDPPLSDVTVDLSTGTVTIHSTDEAEAGPHHICFYAEDDSGYQCEDCMIFTVQAEEERADIALKVKKVEAYPGQQHVCVPVALSLRNPEIEIGGWEVLIWYDPVAGTVVGVDPYGCGVDSVYAHDPEFADPAGWEWIRPLFAESGYEPEYFSYVLGADGHANWVRVIGLMNLDWPQYVTPDLDSADNDILFSLIVDVAPGWEGHEMFFGFEVKNCTDNTFTDSQGNILWGPRGDSRPTWLSCFYHGETDVVELYNYPAGSPGLYIQEVDRGDVNCDCVPYSVADAMMFINYLVYGVDALSGCPSYEVHCQASDVDGDSHCFTINDLIVLIRIINGYEEPLPKPAPAGVIVNLSNGVVSVDKKIGAARFFFSGEGAVSGEDVAFAHREGRTIVLAYTMDDRALGGQLFSIAGDVKLEDVEAADFYGLPMAVHVAPTPTSFDLAPNYPNPFNPITEIRYTLPEDCQVQLEIYNISGQKVASLVDGKQKAGYRTIRWDARSSSSGIYFCRLKAGDFVQTRRMILLK